MATNLLRGWNKQGRLSAPPYSCSGCAGMPIEAKVDRGGGRVHTTSTASKKKSDRKRVREPARENRNKRETWTQTQVSAKLTQCSLHERALIECAKEGGSSGQNVAVGADARIRRERDHGSVDKISISRWTHNERQRRRRVGAGRNTVGCRPVEAVSRDAAAKLWEIGRQSAHNGGTSVDPGYRGKGCEWRRYVYVSANVLGRRDGEKPSTESGANESQRGAVHTTLPRVNPNKGTDKRSK
ncbi:hypothetical protein B0H16DRAFT_1861779 [Mycena metata]|uniref:Uncharacterized protein n=1 Tax=Mycena metata TaxID=1033252 RepID=A0AAD7IF12_9AGAR|nr:hypothetical protein B0H16DRAFT_1861779 [Mycena metata]